MRCVVGTGCWATTCSSSPAPTSTVSRCCGRPRPSVSHPRSWPTATARAFVRRGMNSTSATTTSSAPPSPATTRPSPGSCRPSTTTATSNSARTRVSTAWPARPITPTTRRPKVRPARSTRGGRSNCCPRRTGSSCCRGTSSGCWAGTRPTQARSHPETDATKCSASYEAGLRDISISRSSFSWGVPASVGPGARCLGVVRRPAQLHHRRRVRRPTRRRFEKWWPADHHLVGKDIIRFHAVFWPAMLMAAGLEPPRHVAAHGWLLVGGEKMSKTALNQIAPADLVADFGVDGFRYHFLRDSSFGPRRRLLLRGHDRRATTATWPTTWATSSRGWPRLWPRSAGESARRRRPTVRWPRLPPTPMPPPPPHGTSRIRVKRSRRRGALVRESNAYLETHEPWKAEPGPELDRVLGDALEALRIVAILASPAVPRAEPRDLASSRTCGQCRRSTPARRRWLGRLPRRLAHREGRRPLSEDRFVSDADEAADPSLEARVG